MPGILHLSEVNRHVATILGMSAAKSAAPGWHLPRASSPAVLDGAASIVAGVSSFAFQGTNAHALVQQAPNAAAPATAPPGLAMWSKQRVWVAPPVHILLQTAAASGGGRFARKQAAAVAMEAALSAPQLGFFWQHLVLGLAVFPATAFLEMANGASRQLLNSNDLAGSALRSAVFATPLVLPAPAATAVLVWCVVQAAAGTAQVSSAAGAAAQHRTHFYASVASVAPARSLCASRPANAGACGGMLTAALRGSTSEAAARLAVGGVAVPQEQLGMSMHPAVSEAAMHAAAAHQRQHKALRVAARIEAVQVPLPLPVAERQVWASSLVVAASAAAVAAGNGSSSQEQQLVGSCGTAMLMAGMETRRLMAQVRGRRYASRGCGSQQRSETCILTKHLLLYPTTPLLAAS